MAQLLSDILSAGYPAPNVFSIIAVSGQSNVVADGASDTLTLVAGSNISLTVDAATDAITIASTAAGMTSAQKSQLNLALVGG